MSLSTLQAQHRILQYDNDTFPRFKKTQQRIKNIVNGVIGSIDKVAENFKWTYKMDNPQIVLCYGNLPPSIDLNEFAVHVTYGKQNGHFIYSQLDETVPFLLICVLKNDESGSLTVDDKTMLNGLRELRNEYIENILFVIDQPTDSLKATTFHNLSDEISAELKLDSNDICHRLFCRHNNDIGIRASLYLEKQMLNKYETTKSTLQQTHEGIARLERNLTTNRYFNDYKKVLNDGPFDYWLSLRFMKDAAREYEWYGSSTTRNKWTVDEVKENVARHICERLGNQIAESLIEKFKSDVKSSDLKIAGFLFRNIDVSGIRQAVYEYAILYMVEMIWEGVKAVVTILSTFLFTEDLNSRSFRNKVAQKVHEQIMERKNRIIRSILDKFKALQLPKVQAILKSLNEILITTTGRLECRNTMDCFYHELKIISKRNEHIQAIGYDGGQFCVYVENSSSRAPEIHHYLLKYLKNASQVKIREFKKMKVEEYVNLQSGDQIVRGPLNSSYGTLGFLLKDRDNSKYCATCSHVTKGFEANQLHVRSADGSIITGIYKHEPLLQFDFAVLKLDETSSSVSVCAGLLNRKEELVPGRIFTPDEFTLEPQTTVYKRGAKTGLTEGQYIETYEELDHIKESYPWIMIKNKDDQSFAEKGDSGSLVCFTERDSEVAVCLFIGAYNDPGMFVGCRIADGLSLIKKEIPGINHFFHD